MVAVFLDRGSGRAGISRRAGTQRIGTCRPRAETVPTVLACGRGVADASRAASWMAVTIPGPPPALAGQSQWLVGCGSVVVPNFLHVSLPGMAVRPVVGNSSRRRDPVRQDSSEFCPPKLRWMWPRSHPAKSRPRAKVRIASAIPAIATALAAHHTRGADDRPQQVRDDRPGVPAGPVRVPIVQICARTPWFRLARLSWWSRPSPVALPEDVSLPSRARPRP